MLQGKKLLIPFAAFTAALMLAAACSPAPTERQNEAAAATAEPSEAPSATPEPDATAAPEPTPFTFAWMSDTQEYAANDNAIFCSMTQWIADTQPDWNTVLTIHTGDLIRGSYKDYQWENMKEAFSLLPDDMRILTVGGNHDLISYSDAYTPYLDDRPDTDVEKAHQFDEKGYVYYDTFTEGGVPFIIFSVSYGFEREAADWMNQVLSENADRYAILCFHSYLDPSGYSSVGKRLFGSVVEANPNVHMVLCGHEPGTAYFPEQIDDDGDGTPDRTVFQMMFNMQHEEHGGNGYLRMLRFDSANDTIEVVTYSPHLDVYGATCPGGDGFGASELLENAGLDAYLQ